LKAPTEAIAPYLVEISQKHRQQIEEREHLSPKFTPARAAGVHLDMILANSYQTAASKMPVP